MTKEKLKNSTIWNRDFTILTLGSAVSYMGTATMSFAMGLCILDLFGSVLLYSIYLFVYNAVKIVVSMLAGSYFDRHSRRRAIYLLDFVSAAVYFTYFFVYKEGSANFIFFIGAVIIGVVDSAYRIAFGSLFPMSVPKEKLSRAYAVFSVIETVSCVMVPVAAVLYKFVGMKQIFLIGACLFFIAAVTEIFIRIKEEYAEKGKQTSFTDDLKEGIRTVSADRALITIIAVFAASRFILGVQETTWLPFYKSMSENGYFIYLIVTGANMSGRFMGGSILSFLSIPKSKKYVSMLLFLLISASFHSITLFTSVITACVIQYIAGITDLAAYNITQSSVFVQLEDDRKARFTGIYTMALNVGILSGELISGILSLFISLELINLYGNIVWIVIIIFAVLFFGKKELKSLFDKSI